MELGCGSGRDGAFLIRNGCDWFGIEGSEGMLMRAIDLHPELTGRISLHDMRLPIVYPDTYFDGVFSFAALMHLDAVNARNALKEVHRVLVTGAPFLMSVPLKRMDVDANGCDRDGRFFLPWDDSIWEKALSGAGFSVEQKKSAHDSMGRDMEWLNFVARKNTWIDGL